MRAFSVPASMPEALDQLRTAFANIVVGGLAFLVIWLVARLVRNVVSRAMARRSIRTDAALLATRAIYGVLLGVGIFMFLSLALGQVLVGLTGFLVAALLTSLGLQDLFKNYVSGFYVLMERNVRVGDLVEMGGYRGVVTEVRMRVTYLRGATGEMIVVPNSELFTKTLVVSAAPADWGSGAERAKDDSDQSVEVSVR